MKIFRAISVVVALVLCSVGVSSAGRFPHGGTTSINLFTGSEVVPNFMYAGEFPLLNIAKTQFQSNFFMPSGTGGTIPPNWLDSKGYPKPGVGSWAANGGASVFLLSPGASTLANVGADYVVSITGHGLINIGSSPITNVSCTGSLSGAGCDNTGCSNFTAKIDNGSGGSGNILNVSAASSCTLGKGVPISGAGVSPNNFDVAVFITSNGTTCGSNTCYTLNTSLNVGSESMTVGMRYEFTVANQTNNALDNIQLTIVTSQSGSPVQNLSVVLKADETNYWAAYSPCGKGQACIVGSAFKNRVTQGGWSVLRDLNWLLGNNNICTTWASRRPVNYVGYLSSELRDGAAGTTTYVAGGHTYTIPNPGQYIAASGTTPAPASGGTISYNAGTDTYSIAVNTGNFVDKQTFTILAPANGTTSSKISMNGNTAVPLLNDFGTSGVSFGMTAGTLYTFVYDQDIGGLLTVGYPSASSNGGSGIGCGMPPEVFIEIAAELNMTTWHVLPYLAMDPMTDWTAQFATYLKATYTSTNLPNIAGPIFEVTNEPFNCRTFEANYLSAKSLAHVNADTPNHAWFSAVQWCGPGGNNPAEIGKMASTAGQDLIAVYGSAVEISNPPNSSDTNTSDWNENLRSTAYIGQSLPVQTGYSQVAAYTVNTRISVNNYWGIGAQGSGVEAKSAYCYFYYSLSTGCQSIFASQQAAMDVYMNSATDPAYVNNIASLTTALQLYKPWAQNCSLGSRPGACKINASAPLMAYEGGFEDPAADFDTTQVMTGATNASAAILTVAANGCVAGQTIGLSNLSGGTWSGATGTYTVQASGTDATHCAINLNSTSLGTLGAATFTGSSSGAGNLTLTVTSVTGTIAVGMALVPINGIGAGTTIASQVSGTPGGAGVYTTNIATFVSGASISGGATITYTGSTNYVNYLRQSTYVQPALYTLELASYNAVANNGGINPSQFNLSGGYNDQSAWFVDPLNNWLTPGMQLASCTACTISGSNLTLGGTITGIFTPGLVVTGGFVTGNSLITSCTRNGSGPCGSNATDVLGLSQSSTVASGEAMTASVPPTTIIGGPSDHLLSPVTAFKSICDWNHNTAMCQ